MPPALAASPLVAALAGGALAGIGTGIGGALQANASKDSQKIAAQGPVRGGSERAGNATNPGQMPDASVLAKLGQTMIPLRSPVYGGGPVDMQNAFAPKPFGTGFSTGRPNY